MATAATAATVSRAGAAPARTDRQLLGLALAVVAAPTALLALWRHWVWPPGGDEPHYLIISQALARYHSLDVARIYRTGAFREFYPAPLPLDPHLTAGPHGHVLPLHSIGGPLLWLIPYLAAGRGGVEVFMVAVTLATCVALFWLLRDFGIRSGYAAATVATFGLGSPLLTYSSTAFVEPIGALILVYTLRVLHQHDPGRWAYAVASTGVGVLPWVHSRFALFAALLAGWTVLRLHRDRAGRSRWLCALLPAALLAVAFEVYNVVVWGTLNPAANQASAAELPFTHGPTRGLAGLVFDQESGLIPNFPIFALALPGLLLAARWPRWRLWHVQVATLTVPYVLVVATFRNWYGGFSPPARMLAVVAPLAAPYVAAALQASCRWWLDACAALAVLATLTAETVAMVAARAGFGDRVGRSPVFVYLSPIARHDLGRWVPSSWLHHQAGLFAAWLAALLAVAGAVWLAGTFPRVRIAPAAARVPSQKSERVPV